MTLEDAINDIKTRAQYRLEVVNYAREHDKPHLLSMEWVVRTNNKFWALREKAISMGKVDYGWILDRWREWFQGSAEYA